MLIELQRLELTTVPSTLRLLMGAVTYLEWPAQLERSQQKTELFFRRLKEALGPPQLRPDKELDESDEEENISRIFEELAKPCIESQIAYDSLCSVDGIICA